MKLKFYFVVVMIWNISCAQYEYDTYNKNTRSQNNSKKLAKDAYNIINNKFDNNQITFGYLSDKFIAAHNIKKIIDLTSDLLEIEIPHALRAFERAEEQDLKLTTLRKQALLIKNKIISARQKAVEKAEEAANIASQKALAEKAKAQKAQEALANALVDAKFVQTNMPNVIAAQAARDSAQAEHQKTQAYFHALENFWQLEAPNERIAKTRTYVESAEKSAQEAEIFARQTIEHYQKIIEKNKNLAHQNNIFNTKNSVLKASNNVEAAELAVQEAHIKTMLSLRLYDLDPRNIYTISQAVENSVRLINLASDSIKAAARIDTTGDQQIALARVKLQKISTSFESCMSGASETLFKVARDKLESAQNRDADRACVQAALKSIEVVIDNLKISAKHLKNFGTSLAYNAMKSAYTNAKKFGTLARKAVP